MSLQVIFSVNCTYIFSSNFLRYCLVPISFRDNFSVTVLYLYLYFHYTFYFTLFFDSTHNTATPQRHCCCVMALQYINNLLVLHFPSHSRRTTNDVSNSYQSLLILILTLISTITGKVISKITPYMIQCLALMT